MVNKIVVLPSAILRQKSKPIKKITPKVEDLADKMIDFLDYHSEDELRPIGLSACQLNHSLRMIAFWNNPQSRVELLNRDNIIVLINPELVYIKKQRLVREGCSSIPGKVYLLKRGKIAKIRGTILSGASRSFRGRDLLAQVFQHELNHLDGILIDTIGELMRK